MNKALYSLFPCLLLLLLPVSPLNATHLMGSDIQWQCLGNDTFKITITIYRDCNGVELWNDDLTIKGTDCNYSYSERPFMSAPVDITPTCSKSCTRCTSPACAFPYGIQKIQLTRIVDLGSVSCCQLEISWGQNARNDIITTGMAGQRFHINAMMNKCLATCNNSPVFTNAPVSMICIGECLIYNQGVTDEEGDSLVYSFTSPLVASEEPGNYLSPYSFEKPLQFQGFPNADLPFNRTTCEGLHLDSANGDLKFKPLMAQVTVMAIKVEEYRNGQKIGEVRRDIQLIIMHCPPNNAPVLSGINGTSEFTAEACPGQPLCFDIFSEDEDQGDTLTMEWNNGIPDANFSISGKRRPTGRFCWIPEEGDARAAPYFFTVKLKDDACPFVAATARAYSIYVRPLPSADYVVNAGPCGNYSIEINTKKPPHATIEWAIENYSKPYNTVAPKLDLQLEEGREYPFRLRVQSECSRVYRDTIRTLFSSLLNKHEGEICKGDSILFDPQIPPTLQCRWIDQSDSSFVSHSSILRVAPDRSTSYRLEATDTMGGANCVRADTFRVYVHNAPSLVLKPLSPQCLNSGISSLENFATPANATWKGNGVTANRFSPYQAGVGSHWLGAEITSPATGCTSNDSMQVAIRDLPHLSGTGNFALCITDAVKPLVAQPEEGIWRGKGIKKDNNGQFTFEPQQAGPGKFPLTYIYTDSNGCSNHHVAEAEVFEKPTADFIIPENICEDSIAIRLQGIPEGGIFSGAKIVDSLFMPDVPGTHRVMYTYTGKGGCTDTISKNIRVNARPEVNAALAGNISELCISADATELNGTPAGGTWQGKGVKANTFLPEEAGAGNHRLRYTYQNRWGCSSEDVVQVTVVAAPTVSLKAPQEVCAGEDITLQVSAANVQELTWQSSGNGIFNGHPSETVYHPSSEDIGTGLVKISVSTDGSVCPSTADSVMVIINPIPKVDFSSNYNIGCSSPMVVQFNEKANIRDGNISRYDWDFGNGQLAVGKSPVATYENAGLYTVRLVVVSDKNCSSEVTKEQYIRVNLAPVAAFEASPEITSLSFPEINFENKSVNTAGPAYSWSFGDAMAPDGGISTAENPVHTYSDTGNYLVRLVVQNENGCLDTAFGEIYIHPDMLVYIPNIFSPNYSGPAPNETFRPSVYGTSEYLFQVFDRWGEKVFETTDPEDGWDGRYKGELCPENVHAYVLVVKDQQGKSYRYTGTVTLLR
ncbi:MAG: PKD domain-containing protein [Bacteroidia bacterium]